MSLNNINLFPNRVRLFPGKWDSLRLINANIEHWLSLNDSLIEDDIVMDNLQVGQNLDMLRAEFYRNATLDNIKIGGKFDIEEAKIAGKLGLYNAKVGLFNISLCRDCALKTRLEKLDLRRFQYESIDGVQSEISENQSDVGLELYQWFDSTFINRRYTDETEQYLNWLKLSHPHSPQPYKQLASVLMKDGYDKQADNILYEAKKYEAMQTFNNRQYFDILVVSLQFLSSGYGHRYLITIVVAIALIAIGAIVADRSGVGHHRDFGSVALSFDRLIPLIRLRDKHYQIEFKGWVRWYFYFHQITGWALGLFIVAAMSGSTK